MSDIGTTPRKAMSPTRRLRIWEANSGICVLCQQKIDGTRDKWIVEHIRALGLGGEDTDANCGPAHASCADSKTHGDDIPRIAKATRLSMPATTIMGKLSTPPAPLSEGTDMKKKTVWVLTRAINDYNQDGAYFVAVFESKPDLKRLAETMAYRGYRDVNTDIYTAIAKLEHIRTGGGRQGVEDEWFSLDEVELS